MCGGVLLSTWIRAPAPGQHTNTYTIQTNNSSKYKCQLLPSSSHTYAYRTKKCPRFPLARLLRGTTTHTQIVFTTGLYTCRQEPPQAHPSFASTSLIILTANRRNASRIDTDIAPFLQTTVVIPPRSRAPMRAPPSTHYPEHVRLVRSDNARHVNQQSDRSVTSKGLLEGLINVVSLAQSCDGPSFPSTSRSPRLSKFESLGT